MAITLLLVNALRSRPLDRLDPASSATLALCGVAVIAVYAMMFLRWLR